MVVAGCGVAGLSAAVSAAEQGLRVAVLAENVGPYVDPEMMAEMGGGRDSWSQVTRSLALPDPEVIGNFADHVPETIDWLQSLGGEVRFPAYCLPYQDAASPAACRGRRSAGRGIGGPGLSSWASSSSTTRRHASSSRTSSAAIMRNPWIAVRASRSRPCSYFPMGYWSTKRA